MTGSDFGRKNGVGGGGVGGVGGGGGVQAPKGP